MAARKRARRKSARLDFGRADVGCALGLSASFSLRGGWSLPVARRREERHVDASPKKILNTADIAAMLPAV